MKEERKNSIGQGDTFAPQLVARKGANSSHVKQPDSLDRLATEVTVNTNDIMEQPLAAQRNKRNQMSEVNELPSPNSDALGRELKKFGGANANSNPTSTNNQLQYKSKFLQQYENSGNGANTSNNSKVPAADDDEFANILRSDTNNKRSSGPGWNSDTATDGFVSNRKTNPRGSQSKPQVTNQQQNDNIQDISLQEFRGGFPNSSKNGYDGGRLINENMFPYDENKTRNRNIPNSPRSYDQNAPAPTTTIMTRSAGGDPVITQARSKLSLLKNKIQQSENSNSSRSLRKALSASEVDENFGENRISNNVGGKQYQPYVPNTRDSAANPPRSVRPNPIPNQNTKFQNNVTYNDPDDDDIMVPAPKPISNNNGIASTNRRQSSVGQDPYSERSNLNRPPSGRQHQQAQQQYQPQQLDQRSQQNQQSRNVENQPNGALQQRQPPIQRQQPPPPQQSEEEEEDYDENEDYDEEDEGGEGDVGELMQCPDCGRKFGAIPYAKHVKICAKVFLRKRKAFDSSKMRVQDNPELLKILSKAKKEEMRAKKKQQNAGADDRPVAEAAPKWKNQSEAFRQAMRAAREVAKAQAAGAPLPPPVISAPDPSLIPCPHCGRRFNDKAAERHIPQCKNIKAKPTTLKRGNGVTASAAVKAKR